MLVRAACCVAALVCLWGPANGTAAQEADTEGALEAQPMDPSATEDMERAARALFQAGSVAFDQGRYEDALTHFGEAYKLVPDRHMLLYNIASSYDRLRQDREALDHFERYLAVETTHINKAAVMARVKLLRVAVARLDKAEAEKAAAAEKAKLAEEAEAARKARADEEAAAAAAAANQDDGRGMRTLSPLYTYIGAGVTAALVGVTVWSGLNTVEWKDNYEQYTGLDPRPNVPPQDDFDEAKSRYDSGKAAELRTNILIGASGAALVGTAVVAAFFTDWKGGGSSESPPAASAWVGPTGAGVGYRHAF